MPPAAQNAPTEDELDAYYHNIRKRCAGRVKEFDPLCVEAWFNVIRTFNVGEMRVAGRVGRHGMTLPGLNVLAILRESGPDGLPLNQLSRLLLVTRANITGLIDNLVRKGYVQRVDHLRDRRVTLARITRAGVAWLDGYLPEHYREIRQMLAHLNQTEKRTLAQLLVKLRRGMREPATSSR